MAKPVLKLTETSPLAVAERNARFVLILLYAVLTQTDTNLYWKTTVDAGPARYVALAAFTAFRPYQYRALVPAIVHVLEKITNANSFQVMPLYEGVEWLFVFSSFWVFRAYLSTFVSTAAASVLTFFLLPAMLFIHAVCALGHYPYDTPQIVFFTLGLLALRKENWPLFYGTLIISTFNRETTVLMIPAFALTMYNKMPKTKLVAHLLAQCAIFAAIKIGIDRIFANNPGNFTEDHTKYNIHLVGKLIHGDGVLISTTLIWCGIGWLFWSGREHYPSFTKRLLWLIPLYVAAMWQAGIIDEIRAYNEMVPVFLVPLLLILHGSLKAAEATDVSLNPAQSKSETAKAA